MEQIYIQSDENVEVFTTVFSSQVCRARTRYRNVDVDKVVAAINYIPHWADELEVHQGDVIQVLHREDPSWWFGRLQDGKEGYFPATCVIRHNQNEEPDKAVPSLRRGSMPVVSPSSPRGCTGGHFTPKLPRKESLLRALGHMETNSVSGGSSNQPTPSFLHRVLSKSSKSRRKSCPHIPAASGSSNGAYQPD